jgi:hypothetical protein
MNNALLEEPEIIVLISTGHEHADILPFSSFW